ncbi:putative disease resistance protein At1g50180 [Henckelia pumila]|uniref:putative disease resistance protein At1g50180 n=1 Tax=Henckelia pumila TaxID=405737 RepID=UPI003C6E6753
MVFIESLCIHDLKGNYMAEAVVSVALETLGNLLIEEATFLRGVKDQVKGLQTEFGNLQSLLKDADRKQHDSETIRNWIKEIRSLAYRAEDVLEEYVVKSGSGKGEPGFVNILKRFVCFANEMGTLHNIGSEIETIKSHITILTGKMDKFGIEAIIRRDEYQEESTSDDNKRRFIRKTYAHEELQHFVGMDYDIENLVSLLVSDQEISRHPVIGVWGMGGSGKTTVANKVYKDVRVKRYFESFAWICITQKCQMESVMQDIFRQLLPAETKKDTIDELLEQIYKVQMETRCLIVVDDIWKLDDWKCLSKCFPNVGSHSKVLLTTRNKKVAEIGYPIQLKGITEDEAWELLRMKAFAKIHFKETWDESEYEKLGRKLIRKCERLPLAVAVIGGILSGKNSLEEWKLASEDVNSYIGRGEGTGEQGEVEKVLALSYDELPYHLKPCFLSLGFLREDESIFVESIYDLWMAQGLIISKHVGRNETMRDVAKFYFSELQFRSMVLLHNLSRVSLHDSILELCLSKAKEEEFLKVVDDHNISDKAYRLVAHVDGENNYLDVLKAIENSTIPLRSVQIIHKQLNPKLILPKEIFNLPHFKSLRTLIIFRCYLKGKCFRGIENLIHLRLLGLAGCEWENLSLESVDKLSFLHTLILTGTTLTLLNLPPLDTFCKTPQLRHLYLPKLTDIAALEAKVRMRLMNLSQLECLYGFQSKFYDLKDLCRLEMLRTLRQCEVNDEESLVQITDYICGSNLIRWIDISIQNCDLNGQQESDALRKLLEMPNVTLELSIRSCELSKLPRLETADFSKICPGLVHLTLDGIQAYIAEDVMQALDKFPNLKTLQLLTVRFGGEEMICGPGSFPRLEKLDLYMVAGKFELRIDEAAMPNLSYMLIFNCYGINFMIPQRLRSFAQMNHCNSCVFN